LNSVDATRRSRRIIGVSRQERLRIPEGARRLCLTKGTVKHHRTGGPGDDADGALINSSSTFGTLLSSQGSSAHHRLASRQDFGATWSNLPVLKEAVNFVPRPGTPSYSGFTRRSTSCGELAGSCSLAR
jgi:hypothetical protein